MAILALEETSSRTVLVYSRERVIVVITIMVYYVNVYIRGVYTCTDMNAATSTSKGSGSVRTNCNQLENSILL